MVWHANRLVSIERRGFCGYKIVVLRFDYYHPSTNTSSAIIARKRFARVSRCVFQLASTFDFQDNFKSFPILVSRMSSSICSKNSRQVTDKILGKRWYIFLEQKWIIELQSRP